MISNSNCCGILGKALKSTADIAGSIPDTDCANYVFNFFFIKLIIFVLYSLFTVIVIRFLMYRVVIFHYISA